MKYPDLVLAILLVTTMYRKDSGSAEKTNKNSVLLWIDEFTKVIYVGE